MKEKASSKVEKKNDETPIVPQNTVKSILPDNEGNERFIPFEDTVEAVLFAAGHPIKYEAFTKIFEMTPGKIKDRIFEYALRYNASAVERGVTFLTFADSCQLCTKPGFLPEIREVLGIKKSGTLSTSSMEALAIVAYNQPTTRVFVDTLRRADSSYAMNNLLDRGLIESKGRLDVPGRPMLYGTTNDFLRCFGLNSLDELPQTTEEMIDRFARTGKVNAPDEESAAQQEVMALDDVMPTSDTAPDAPDTPSDGTENNAALPSDSATDGTHDAAGIDSPDEPGADDTLMFTEE